MFSKRLIAEMDELRKQIRPLNLLDRDISIKSLTFIFQVVVASEDLIKTASEMPCITDFDRELRDYYKEHLIEETGHVAWFERDLTEAGVDIRNEPISLLAAQIVGVQYYAIKHMHQAALLGYMAFLEGYPMPIEHVEALENAHGKNLYRTIRYHAVNDLLHREDVFRMIDKTPENLQSLVLQSARQTALYTAQY